MAIMKIIKTHFHSIQQNSTTFSFKVYDLPSHRVLTTQWCQVYVSCGVGQKSNQSIVGYSPDAFATIELVSTSYKSSFYCSSQVS